MDNSKVKLLCNHLEQEINWVTALNALLAEEKKVLETRQFNQLEDCASRKQDLCSKLEESGKQRMVLMNKQEQISAEVALKEFLQNCNEAEITQVSTLNSTLAKHLHECRELNSINGQVIANNLYVRQELISSLSGNKNNAANVYNSHGGLSSSNEHRHHEEA